MKRSLLLLALVLFPQLFANSAMARSYRIVCDCLYGPDGQDLGSVKFRSTSESHAQWRADAKPLCQAKFRRKVNNPDAVGAGSCEGY